MSIESTSEAAIFERVVVPGEPAVSKETAHWLLSLGFGPDDTEHMRILAEKCRAGALTPDEQRAIDNYERVGHYLSILQSKARVALRQSTDAGS